MNHLNQIVFIMAFTVDIQFTFCCGTCDVSTLVRMIRHNICIIKMYSITGRKVIF